MGKGDILFDVMILSRCGKLLNIFLLKDGELAVKSLAFRR